MSTRSVSSTRTGAGNRISLTPKAPLFPNDISISTNLVLWLDANKQVYTDAGLTLATNGQTIQQWNDLSGNTNTVTQSTSGNRPTLVTNVLNNQSIIRFNATNSNFMSAVDSASLDISSHISIFTVIIPTTVYLATNQGILCKDISGALTNSPYEFILLNKNNPRFDTTSSANSNSTAVSGAFISRNPYMMEGIYNGTSLILYINGSSIKSIGNSNNIGTTTGNLNIGQQKVGNSFFYGGDIGEIIIYNTGLNTTKQQGIEAYLAQKWGINTALNRGGVAPGLRSIAQ